MDTPQEVQVWFILPALRRQLAIGLKKEGMTQREIASKLNITESAISQYFRKKRGEEIRFSEDMFSEIAGSADAIAHRKVDVKTEIQRLMKKISETRFICTVCNEFTDSEKDCEICYE